MIENVCGSPFALFRRTAARLLLIVLLASAAAVALAAPDPVLRRGFSADGVYDVSGIDSVDLYTGNLNVRIPLGQKYQTNGALSYQFALTYNSSLWDFWDQSSPTIAGESVMVFESFISVNTWDREDPGFAAQEAIPARSSNAGLGWRVSLGDIEGGLNGNKLIVRYVDESGAAHAFYSRLHGDLSTDSETLNGAGPFYARDGSFLRMRRTDDLQNASSVVSIEIDSPDGVVRRFSCHNCAKTGISAGQWNLDEIVDQFGNALVITRTTINGASSPLHPPEGHDWKWTFTEKAAAEDGYPADTSLLAKVREHTATFRVNRIFRAGTREIAAEILLKELNLAACCDAASAATYTFSHEPRDVYRPHQSSWNGPGMIIPNRLDGVIALQSLRAVTLPRNSSSGTIRAGTWEFRYLGDDSGDDLHKLPATSTRAATSDYSGRLKLVRYPTGGGMRYEYQNRAFIKVACDPEFGAKPIAGGRYQRFLAVKRRQPFNGSGDVGRGWLYTFAKYPLAAPEKCGLMNTTQPKDVTAGVIDPAGKATVTYFSNFVGNDHTGSAWTHTELGLPFTHHEADPLDATRFLSEEVYDCSAADLTDPAETIRLSIARSIGTATPRCAGPLRKTYVRFENSGVACDIAAGLGNCSNASRRVASTRTEYRDVCEKPGAGSPAPYCMVNPRPDEHRWIAHDYSHYDGLGHYRVEKVSGDFYAQAFPSYTQRAAADQRRTTTWWNDGTTFDPATKAFSGRDLSQAAHRWLLNTYSFTKVTAFDRSLGLTKSQYTHYRFDTRLDRGTGILLGWRKLLKLGGDDADTSRGDALRHAQDVMMRQVRARTSGAGLGQAVTLTQAYYGGSVQGATPGGALATDALSRDTLPAVADYTIRATHAYGATARSEYVCGSSSFLLVQDNAVDPNTGLVTSSKDAWGVPATYGYDPLGRFTSITEPGEAPVTYAYPPMTFNANAWTVTATQTSVDGSSAGTLSQEYVYDPLGRLVDTKRNVEGVKSVVHRAFGPDLLLASTSNEKKDGEGGFNNTTYVYDVFGRPVETKRPGESHDIRAKYYGIQRVTVTTSGIASTRGTEPEAATTYADALGRTIKVDDAEGQRTTYAYDYAGRLTLVEMSAGDKEQRRKWLYDGRGFLTDESMPELLHQSVEYSAHDTRGNAGKKSYYRLSATGAKTYETPFSLSYEYDRAERLVAVKNAAGKAIKTFSYDRGRIKTAGRTNDIPDPQATKLGSSERQVTMIYDYDAAGRLASQTLSAGFMATTLFPSNDLGLVKSVTYPAISCETAAECSNVAPVRSVSYTYGNGWLDRVTSGVQTLISGIEYHPNGLWKTITRGNTTKDSQTIENDYPRPAGVSASRGTDTLWTSGAIAYDGYGNVRTAGTDRFLYDGVGRLTTAALNGTAQKLQYDRFGNITSMTTGATSTTFEYVQFGGVSSNRISTIGGASNGHTADYDLAGNMTRWTDPRRPSYEMNVQYDDFNMPEHTFLKNPEGKREFGRVYLYDANDERVAVIDYALKGTGTPAVRETWSIRGASNQVIRDAIREKSRATGAWSWRWGRDYVHRDGALFAEIVPPATGTTEVVRHMHLDHLGSVRAVTEAGGALKEQRKYYPFGEPMASTTPTGRMAFAGHERDDDQTASPYGDLDYMHARYYAPVLGRFLSIDPKSSSGKLQAPQSWNRYAYALNNPVTLIDPAGAEPERPMIYWFHLSSYDNIPSALNETRLGHAGIGWDRFDITENNFKQMYRNYGPRDVVVLRGHGVPTVNGGGMLLESPAMILSPHRIGRIMGDRNPPGLLILQGCCTTFGAQEVADLAGTTVLAVKGGTRSDENEKAALMAAYTYALTQNADAAAAMANRYLNTPCDISRYCPGPTVEPEVKVVRPKGDKQ